MKIQKAIVAGVLAAATIGSGSAIAATGQSQYHEQKVVAPHWMTNVCKHQYSVNCWNPKWDAFVRDFGTKKHPLVCVMYVRHPKRDYCA